MQVILDELEVLHPGQYELCDQAGLLESRFRGWPFKSCKLVLEAQAAFDAILADGTYARLLALAIAFPAFDEECLLAGAGESFLVRPPYSLFSIVNRAIDPACLLCKPCLRELNCPCIKSNVVYHPIAGSIVCPTIGDCSSCVVTRNQ